MTEEIMEKLEEALKDDAKRAAIEELLERDFTSQDDDSTQKLEALETQLTKLTESMADRDKRIEELESQYTAVRQAVKERRDPTNAPPGPEEKSTKEKVKDGLKAAGVLQ